MMKGGKGEEKGENDENDDDEEGRDRATKMKQQTVRAEPTMDSQRLVRLRSLGAHRRERTET